MLQILLFTTISVAAALIQSVLIGELSPIISLLSLGLGFFGTWFLTKELNQNLSEVSVSFRSRFNGLNIFEKGVFGFIALAGALQFVNLLVVTEGHYAVGNPNNLGDMPLHINYIRALARGLHFWPDNTEFAGVLLKYPFGMDLLNALFESIGLPLRSHLFVVGVVFLIITFLALFRRAGVWGLSALFLSGGFVAMDGFLIGNGWGPGTSVDWKNLFLSVVVTQRGFLFALPAGLWLLENAKRKSLSPKEQVAFGIIWGLLAFFHLHSFLIVSVFLVFTFLLQKNVRQFFKPGLVSTAIALPFLILVFVPGHNLGNAIGWSWGWTFLERANDMSFMFYLLQNFAGFILVLILCSIAVFKKQSVRLEFGFLILLWLVFFNVRVAPWAWDNIKVLLWIYLLVHFWFYDHVLKSFERPQNWQKNVILLCVFAPGFFQLAASFPSRGRPYRIGPPVALADCVRNRIGINDVVVASNPYDHALYFQGHKMALGFEGHVWSHGYDLGKRKAQVQSILNFAPGWPQAAKELDAKWLVRRKNEPEISFSNWDSVVATTSECEDYIYDLSSFKDTFKDNSNDGAFDFGSPDSASKR